MTDGKPGERETDNSRQGQESLPVPVIEQEHTDARNEAARRQQEADRQQRIAKVAKRRRQERCKRTTKTAVEFLAALATVAIAALTAAYVIYSARQWRTMERQLGLTANLQRKSQPLLVCPGFASEKPQTASHPRSEKRYIRWNMSCQNDGREPARIVWRYINFSVSPAHAEIERVFAVPPAQPLRPVEEVVESGASKDWTDGTSIVMNDEQWMAGNTQINAQYVVYYFSHGSALYYTSVCVSYLIDGTYWLCTGSDANADGAQIHR